LIRWQIRQLAIHSSHCYVEIVSYSIVLSHDSSVCIASYKIDVKKKVIYVIKYLVLCFSEIRYSVNMLSYLALRLTPAESKSDESWLHNGSYLTRLERPINSKCARLMVDSEPLLPALSCRSSTRLYPFRE
jgi:hypothetical protein